MEEVLCKDCKWYCIAIKDEPFCNHHHIELVQSGCFEGERKVKTNADKIREMSDEELAEMLCGYQCNTCDYAGFCDETDNCEADILNWLAQEVGK